MKFNRQIPLILGVAYVAFGVCCLLLPDYRHHGAAMTIAGATVLYSYFRDQRHT